jgi:hypothetical protein
MEQLIVITISIFNLIGLVPNIIVVLYYIIHLLYGEKLTAVDCGLYLYVIVNKNFS